MPDLNDLEELVTIKKAIALKGVSGAHTSFSGLDIPKADRRQGGDRNSLLCAFCASASRVSTAWTTPCLFDSKATRAKAFADRMHTWLQKQASTQTHLPIMIPSLKKTITGLLC